MLQAIAEGVDLLEHYRETLPIADVAGMAGATARSSATWLIDLMAKSFREGGGARQRADLCRRQPARFNWLVDDAMRMDVPTPVYHPVGHAAHRLARQTAANWARAPIAMMRHGFGGHPFGPDKGVEQERRTGRGRPAFPTTRP